MKLKLSSLFFTFRRRVWKKNRMGNNRNKKKGRRNFYNQRIKK